MKFQAKKESFQTHGVFKRNFDFVDSKRRTIGASAWKWSQVLTPVPQEEIDRGWFGFIYEGEESLNGTTVFAYQPHGLRAGEYFGASQGTFYFRTEAERDAAAEKYFKNAEKRAAKLAAKQ